MDLSLGQHDLACCTQVYPLAIEGVFGARITAEDLHVTAMNWRVYLKPAGYYCPDGVRRDQ